MKKFKLKHISQVVPEKAMDSTATVEKNISTFQESIMYLLSRIVVDRCVKMRECKHGCDVLIRAYHPQGRPGRILESSASPRPFSCSVEAM